MYFATLSVTVFATSAPPSEELDELDDPVLHAVSASDVAASTASAPRRVRVLFLPTRTSLCSNQVNTPWPGWISP
jgi:hypothetical protein